MTFAQRRNRITTRFSERIPVVKRHISEFHWLCCWLHNYVPGFAVSNPVRGTVVFPKVFLLCYEYSLI